MSNDNDQSKKDAELAAESAEEAAERAEEAAEQAQEAAEQADSDAAAEKAAEAELAAEQAEEAAEQAEEAAESDDEEESYEEDDLVARASSQPEKMTREAVEASDVTPHIPLDAGVVGVAAFFDHPHHLMYAASKTRDSDYTIFEAYSPFPIHGMDDAMGLGRSWIPWVTFGAGLTGLATAAGLQFGIMGFDWPMIFQGKPFFAWPSFVPIMFELTVLFAGVTTGLVMLAAAGCFRRNLVIDPEITNDRFVLWISADDERFEREGVIDFMKGLNPTEIRTIKKEA